MGNSTAERNGSIGTIRFVRSASSIALFQIQGSRICVVWRVFSRLGDSGGGGLGIFLPEPPQLIHCHTRLDGSQAANQIEDVLGRELTVVLPFQTGWMDRPLGVGHKRASN